MHDLHPPQPLVWFVLQQRKQQEGHHLLLLRHQQEQYQAAQTSVRHLTQQELQPKVEG